MAVSVVYHPVHAPHKTSKAIAKNISLCSCLLEVSSPIEVGSRLYLKIDHACFQNLKSKAIVRHVRKRNTKYYVNVDFEELDEAFKYGIISWIHEVESDIVDSTLHTA
jgi:c-di-GMP-binding flagellar brake protein YcgR